jgi:hypothetical protein
MAKQLGARRPAFRRKVLWIAAMAIFLVAAWAKTGFPCPLDPCWFQMGPDGVLGMMPPNYPVPYATSGGGAQPKFTSSNGENSLAMMPAPQPLTKNVPPPPDMVIVEPGKKGHSYKYTAPAKGPVYLIKRDGTPWVIVTYNAATKLYELTDPNGPSVPVLKVGVNAFHR